jgi:putative nucleotidyltransferase with HDIG domain
MDQYFSNLLNFSGIKFTKKLVIFLSTLVVASMGTALVVIYILYSAALGDKSNQLLLSASSVAHVVDATLVLRPDINRDELVSVFQTAMEKMGNKGLGDTGELTFGRVEDTDILFLTKRRHATEGISKDATSLNNLRLPLVSDNAAPMRKALNGQTGTTMALDYRGEVVIAGYAPITEVGWGVVTKIDISEVRRPFLWTFFLSILLSVIISYLGVWFVYQRNQLELTEIERAKEKLAYSLRGTVYALSQTVEKRDPYTSGHQTRVAELSVAIGRKLGMNGETLFGLRMGALIHDIGKINIPSEILNRPGKLSNEEFQLIKTHCQIGHEIIRKINLPWPVDDIIFQHHEKLDGSGYPHGLIGDEISLEAQIVAVADVVEAMSSHRPYRPALGTQRALEFIKSQKNTKFNGEAVDACIALIEQEGFNFEDDTMWREPEAA